MGRKGKDVAGLVVAHLKNKRRESWGKEIEVNQNALARQFGCSGAAVYHAMVKLEERGIIRKTTANVCAPSIFVLAEEFLEGEGWRAVYTAYNQPSGRAKRAKPKPVLSVEPILPIGEINTRIAHHHEMIAAYEMIAQLRQESQESPLLKEVNDLREKLAAAQQEIQRLQSDLETASRDRDRHKQNAVTAERKLGLRLEELRKQMGSVRSAKLTFDKEGVVLEKRAAS